MIQICAIQHHVMRQDCWDELKVQARDQLTYEKTRIADHTSNGNLSVTTSELLSIGDAYPLAVRWRIGLSNFEVTHVMEAVELFHLPFIGHSFLDTWITQRLYPQR